VADQSDVRLREHQSSSVEVLDVQGDGENAMTTAPGFAFTKNTSTTKSSPVLKIEEGVQELSGAEGQGWEEDELLDVDLEEVADTKETNAKHEGEVVHGKVEVEPEQKAQTLHALLSSPHISLSKELEVVPEHGWEDEEVLDLGDLEEPVPVVEKVEPVQKLEGASSDQPKLVDP